MPNYQGRKPEDDVWFVHAPLKNDKRDTVYANPPSNIPYLNGVPDEPNVNEHTMWFKETDSDFIRLSKLGGRQDLLVHKLIEKPKEPQPYPRAAWWTDMLTEVESGEKKKNEPYVFQVPSWFAHQDKIKQSNQNSNEGLSCKSVGYQAYKSRQYEPIKEPTKFGQIRNYLHPIKVKNNNEYYSSNQTYQESYVAYNQTLPSPVHMAKLLSNEYQTERPKDYDAWLNNQGVKK